MGRHAPQLCFTGFGGIERELARFRCEATGAAVSGELPLGRPALMLLAAQLDPGAAALPAGKLESAAG